MAHNKTVQSVMGRDLSSARLLTIGVLVIGLTAMVAGCGGQGGNQGGEGEEAESLRMVSFLPSNHQLTRDVVPMWIDRVEEETEGAVTIEWVGPEAIPPEDQFQAVSDGVADVGFNVGTYYENQVPTIPSMQLSPYTPSRERDTEYFDYLTDTHEQAGVNYLGRWLSTSPFYFWNNEEIETPGGFEGATFRSNPTYNPILQEMGAEPVNVAAGDVYTSLERGVVTGFGFPILGPQESGWTEVTKYIIDEPYLVQNGTILINPDTFNSLSPEAQEGLRTATKEFEPEMQEHFVEAAQQEWDSIQQEAGVERVEFSSEDSDEFLNMWVDVYWGNLEDKAPDEVERLKELLPPEELKQKFSGMSEGRME